MALPVSQKITGDLAVSSNAIIETYIAGEAITAGQTVIADVSVTDITLINKTVKIGGAAGAIKGIALNTAASGAEVRVIRRGYTTGILTDGSVVVATPQMAPAASGAVKVATTSTLEVVGFALADDVSTASALVYINCL